MFDKLQFYVISNLDLAIVAMFLLVLATDWGKWDFFKRNEKAGAGWVNVLVVVVVFGIVVNWFSGSISFLPAPYPGN